MEVAEMVEVYMCNRVGPMGGVRTATCFLLLEAMTSCLVVTVPGAHACNPSSSSHR